MESLIQKAVVDYLEQHLNPTPALDSHAPVQEPELDFVGGGYWQHFQRGWMATDMPQYILGDALFDEMAIEFRYHRSEKQRFFQELQEQMPRHVWEKLSDISSPDVRRQVKEQTGKVRDIRWIFQVAKQMR